MSKTNEVGLDVIRRCREGDRAAFRTLVEHYQRWLFGLGLKLLCDEEEARDVVQETLLRVWLHLADYDEHRNFTTWVGTICTRLCLDRLRQLSHHEEWSDDAAALRELADEDSPDRRLENQELAAVIGSRYRVSAPSSGPSSPSVRLRDWTTRR